MHLNVEAALSFDFSSSVSHQILGLTLSTLSFPSIRSLEMCVEITGFKPEECDETEELHSDLDQEGTVGRGLQCLSFLMSFLSSHPKFTVM